MSNSIELDNAINSRQSTKYSGCGYSVFQKTTFRRNVLDAISDGDLALARQSLHTAQHYQWQQETSLLDNVPDLNNVIISSASTKNSNLDFAGLGTLQIRLRNIDLLKLRRCSANQQLVC